MRLSNFAKFVCIAVSSLLAAGCGQAQTSGVSADLNCASSQATGISLPAGFCASVFADELGPARHMAVAGDGSLYVALANPTDGGAIVALKDSNGDGQADKNARFAQTGGTGLAIQGDKLFFGTVTEIRRYTLSADSLAPQGEPDIVVKDLPQQRSHSARSLAVNDAGDLFINIGAPSNACQVQDRKPGSKGQDPCPLLEAQGGIWRYQANETSQTHSPSNRYASGVRNAVALSWDTQSQQLYLVQHGRDQLHQNWPDRFTQKQSANLPAEELFQVNQGDDFGWPYCYYDDDAHKKVLAPEYGGDGRKVGRCDKFEDPIVAFPAHWAPNGLLFYGHDAFPEKYHGGAFVAFHGSWNRAPLPQQGYNVVFTPFNDGKAASDNWQAFAQGFAGTENLKSPGNAEYRPTGLAQGPDGALYVSDDTRGRIWRITYTGK